MLEGLKAAATGMTAQQQRMDALSNDIANVNTTGYKLVSGSRRRARRSRRRRRRRRVDEPRHGPGRPAPDRRAARRRHRG
jgi:flagellar basal body rod protein FlgG